MIAARARSVGHAARGVGSMLRTEANARVHLAATVAVVAAASAAGVDLVGWAALVLAIAAVWTAEALNTALEALADAAAPERSRAVGRAKDVAAGGVLLAAVGAAVVGALVLGDALYFR